ncbi:MAG TPA: hypothetical protein VD837_05440 [Terriglobales bacterium]|nr:hypothetical protein [Terriglobales bacterium]
MQKLIEVEQARAIMNEAVDWSVMKWLKEKKRVRKAADVANAILDRTNEKTKARWSESLKLAYSELKGEDSDSGNSSHRGAKQGNTKIDSQTRLIAKRVKEADDEAYRARMDAEDTFDLAEKRLSTALAREGCRKAINSWDLHEKAIRTSEEAMHPSKAES